MSGHHPPSWNHHPMQVPPYIPRQLPMAHMSSNERPWNNSSSGPPIHHPPPSLSSGGPGQGPPPPPEHNHQYPYNRKHAMDMNPMLPPQFSRHSMPPPPTHDNSYDSNMMDLSVSRNNHNNQYNNADHHHQHHQQQIHSQDYSNRYNNHHHHHQQNLNSHHNLRQDPPSCDGPPNGSDGYLKDIDILNRRQNPVGLPPMSEPMELVKEALLKTIKSQVASLNDINAFNHHPTTAELPEPLIHKPPQQAHLDSGGDTGGGGVNLSMTNNINSNNEGENNTNNSHSGINTVPKESRRKTRKPNKTSKVVNDELCAMTVVPARSSTDNEEDVVDGGGGVTEKDTKEGDHERSSGDHIVDGDHRRGNDVANNKRQANTDKESAEEVKEPEVVKKRKRSSRRSKDNDNNSSTPVDEPPGKESNKSTSINNSEQKEDTELNKQNGSKVINPPEDQNQNQSSPTNGGDESHNGVQNNNKSAPIDPDVSFEDVENKLTEMFAGIADADEVESTTTVPKPEEPVNSTPPPPVPPAKKPIPRRRDSICHLSMLIGDKDLDSDDDDFCLEEVQKKPKARKRAAPAKKGAKNTNGVSKKRGSTSKAAVNNNKKKKKGGGGNKWDDEVLPAKKPSKESDEVRYRGPLLQVRQDGFLGVLNGPQGQTEDDLDTRNGVKVKKFLHNGAERNKVIRGLHTNTLSMKYDTDRTDTTWICVFCKLGPHKLGLGDLFGPYMATTECDAFRAMEANTGDLFKSNRSRLDMVQSAPHRLPAVPATAAIAAMAALKSPNSKVSPVKRGPKKKQQQQFPQLDVPSTSSTPVIPPNEDLYLGLTKATDTSYEIWMHEDCMVWGSGIHMIAGRLVGVDDAVWGSTSSRCSLCQKAGAVVCCLHRGCSERVHVPCARQSNWQMDDGVLHSYCQGHGMGREGGVAGEGVGQEVLPSTSSR